MPQNYYYNPYYYQPQPQPYQRQTTPQSPFRNVMFLNAKEVAGRIIDPNTTELFIDRETKTAYVKSADQTGFSATKAYRFEEIIDQDENGLSTPLKSNILGDYVKKEAFDSFAERVSDKLGQLESKLSAKELKGE